MFNLGTSELNKVFIGAIRDIVSKYSDIDRKPLDIDLLAPYPLKVRLYIYNLTHPPGGRTTGEHKIQLIVPGQNRGDRSTFDYSDGRYILLVGFQPETEVFALWDAGMYPEFSYSRNVQVRAETVYRAFAGLISTQERILRGQGKEIVVTSNSASLKLAIQKRYELTLERLTGGTF